MSLSVLVPFSGDELSEHGSSIGVLLQQQKGICRLLVGDSPGKISAPLHDDWMGMCSENEK